MNKKDIYTAIDALQKAAPVKADWFDYNKPAEYGDGDLLIEANKKKYNFRVELKNELRTVNIPKLTALKEHYNNILVIAKVIYPNIGKKLQELHINYIDTLGNIFIQQGELLLLINGDKPPAAVATYTGRAFNKAGLRFVFNLLTQKDFLQKSYRKMAAECETALGNINYIVKDLQEQNYLAKKNKKDWSLMNKESLITQWAENYIKKLQPDLLIGTFRFKDAEGIKNWKDLKFDINKTQWGGEPGADILTNYLQPATLTLYTDENRIDLIKNYRLLPDNHGNINIFTKFWRTGEKAETVHPLIVYADLIGINDPRTIEVANLIYNEYLKK